MAECDAEEDKHSNNEVFAIIDYNILQKIFECYKGNILDQSKMVEALRSEGADEYIDKDLDLINTLDSISGCSTYRGF